MSVSTARLAQTMKQVETGSTEHWILKTLIIESLSDQQRLIYESVKDNARRGHTTDSRFIAEHLAVSIQWASTVLARLYQWGLLQRERVITEYGREYNYTTPTDGSK